MRTWSAADIDANDIVLCAGVWGSCTIATARYTIAQQTIVKDSVNGQAHKRHEAEVMLTASTRSLKESNYDVIPRHFNEATPDRYGIPNDAEVDPLGVRTARPLDLRKDLLVVAWGKERCGDCVW